MALWTVRENGAVPLAQTKLDTERILERNLEDWIAKEASLLGEPLLVIGRQVPIPDTKDRIDLLAFDTSGHTTIIELKRGSLKDPVDIQALRYASYVSRWKFEDFESVARNYLGRGNREEFNFNSVFEDFCAKVGVEVEEVPKLNEEQRVIIVGTGIRDKLGSVALWLREHQVDIKLVEVQVFKEGRKLYLHPSVIVPVPVSRFESVGTSRGDAATPWLKDGRAWHLEKRCGPQTRNVLLSLDELVTSRLSVEGPHWNQRYYVAYRVNGYNWLCVNTKPRTLVLDFLVRANAFGTTKQLAKRLGVKVFDKEDVLSDKLSLPTSVFIRKRNAKTDRVRLRVKGEFNFRSKSFLRFLDQAFAACPTTGRALVEEIP